MCGSGTTCAAAKRLGRYYVGIDCSPEYARLAASRVGCPCLSFTAERRAG
jgi:site-specific DNA-methyltransferase (adenine-specific)